jgi:Asp-tRNA(Asn)/Glu-tRNA(Gln) amidotransferase B subunit
MIPGRLGEVVGSAMAFGAGQSLPAFKSSDMKNCIVPSTVGFQDGQAMGTKCRQKEGKSDYRTRPWEEMKWVISLAVIACFAGLDSTL